MTERIQTTSSLRLLVVLLSVVLAPPGVPAELVKALDFTGGAGNWTITVVDAGTPNPYPHTFELDADPTKFGYAKNTNDTGAIMLHQEVFAPAGFTLSNIRLEARVSGYSSWTMLGRIGLGLSPAGATVQQPYWTGSDHLSGVVTTNAPVSLDASADLRFTGVTRVTVQTEVLKGLGHIYQRPDVSDIRLFADLTPPKTTGLYDLTITRNDVSGLPLVNPEAGPLDITHKQVRDDKYELSVKDYQWTEGWGELDQFFPRHFNPACTLHLFLQNKGKADVHVTNLLYNGAPIADVCTRPDFAGPVIWYRANPDVIPPGGTAMVYVRLRKALAEKVTIGVQAGNGKTVSTDFHPGDGAGAADFRIVSVGFDLEQNKMFVFLRNFGTGRRSIKRCLIEGRELPESAYLALNPDFAGDNPAYLEITPEKQLEFGQFLLLAVEDQAGNRTAYQLRVRDDKILLGMIGGVGNVPLYRENLFNMNLEMGSTAAVVEEGFWESFADNDLSYIETANTLEDLQRAIAEAPKERLVFGTTDEPDGVDCMWYNELPYMDRCGVNVMQLIEPRMGMVRKHAPSYLTQVLVNRTYSPANWYIYGETPDLFFNDAYPLYHNFASDSLAVVPPTVSTELNAISPRPLHMVLWGCMDTTMRRAYTPLENDMQVHYAIGSGARGIHYFMDRTVYYSERYFVGPTNIKPLWSNMGRLNAKITRIASLLNAGYPFDVATSSNDNELWVGSLLGGKDSVVIVAVNKNYNVRASGATKKPFIFPVEDETIELDLPDWIEPAKVVEVSWDRVDEVQTQEQGGKTIIPVRDMMESRIYVVSSDPKIERRLELSRELMDRLARSEDLRPRSGESLGALDLRNEPIELTADQVNAKSYTLEFDAREDLEKAMALNVKLAEIDLIPGEGLALFPFQDDLEGRGELIYGFVSDVPVTNIQATLVSTTPNFAYCANNTLEISATNSFGYIFQSETYVKDISFKTLWNGGSGENLEVALEIPLKQFYIKVTMKDPEVVWSGEYANTIKRLEVSWDL